jgi:hypothetical protein
VIAEKSQSKGCELRSDELLVCLAIIGDVGFATDEMVAVKNSARAGSG